VEDPCLNPDIRVGLPPLSHFNGGGCEEAGGTGPSDGEADRPAPNDDVTAGVRVNQPSPPDCSEEAGGKEWASVKINDGGRAGCKTEVDGLANEDEEATGPNDGETDRIPSNDDTPAASIENSGEVRSVAQTSLQSHLGSAGVDAGALNIDPTRKGPHIRQWKLQLRAKIAALEREPGHAAGTISLWEERLTDRQSCQQRLQPLLTTVTPQTGERALPPARRETSADAAGIISWWEEYAEHVRRCAGCQRCQKAVTDGRVVQMSSPEPKPYPPPPPPPPKCPSTETSPMPEPEPPQLPLELAMHEEADRKCEAVLMQSKAVVLVQRFARGLTARSACHEIARKEWVDYYLYNRNYAGARALGWDGNVLDELESSSPSGCTIS